MRIGAIMLALCLCAGAAWAQESPGPPSGPAQLGPGYGPEHFMGRRFMQLQAYSLDRLLRLELTPEQRTRLCNEAYEKAAKLRLLRAELSNVRLKIACLENLDKIDEAQLREAFNKTAQLGMDLFLARQDYIKVVETILTKEQLTILRSQPPVSRPSPRQMMRQPQGPFRPGPAQPPQPPKAE